MVVPLTDKLPDIVTAPPTANVEPSKVKLASPVTVLLFEDVLNLRILSLPTFSKNWIGGDGKFVILLPSPANSVALNLPVLGLKVKLALDSKSTLPPLLSALATKVNTLLSSVLELFVTVTFVAVPAVVAVVAFPLKFPSKTEATTVPVLGW